MTFPAGAGLGIIAVYIASKYLHQIVSRVALLMLAKDSLIIFSVLLACYTLLSLKLDQVW